MTRGDGQGGMEWRRNHAVGSGGPEFSIDLCPLNSCATLEEKGRWCGYLGTGVEGARGIEITLGSINM